MNTIGTTPTLNHKPGVPSPGSGGFLRPETVVNEFAIQEGMKVADFGSGSGYFTILIAKIVEDTGKVTAIDVLSDVLEHMKAKASEEGISNIDLVRANLEVPGSSGLDENSQDAVVIVNVLFQSNKKESIIDEAKRVLKPNSKLILVEWKKGVNGFGPPDDERVDEKEMENLVTGRGFETEREINAGNFHYGFIFVKK